MTGYLTLSKSSAAATSTWTGTDTRRQGVIYSTPTTDYDNVTISVPAAMQGSIFEAVSFTYTLSSASGSAGIQFSDTRETFTNAKLLERLRQGATSVQLLFSFRATGGSGGIGNFSSTKEWQNIRCAVTYSARGAVTGELDVGNTSVNYSFTEMSALISADTPLLSLIFTPSAAVSKVTVAVGTDDDNLALTEIDVNAPAGTACILDKKPISLEGLELTERITAASMQLTLSYADGSESSELTETEFILLSSRLAPVVTYEWTDEAGHYSTYGKYVAGHSIPRLTMEVTLDTEADSDITIASRVLTVGGRTYESGDLSFDPDISGLSGAVAWSLTVYDSKGQYTTVTGTINVLAYEAPALTALSFERYKAVLDEHGDTHYELSDDSPLIWVTVAGAVAELNGHNLWTLKAEYGEDSVVNMDGGADGGIISHAQDRTLFTPHLTENQSHLITVTLEDTLSSVSYTVTVPKAGGLFNIEKGGVAVGQRSTGTAAAPKFEVNYPAHFKKGVFFEDPDGGWKDLTLTSAFEAWGTSDLPQYRKIGPLVFIRGAVRTKTSIAAGSYTAIATLPTGFFSTVRRLQMPVLLATSGYSQNGALYVDNASGNFQYRHLHTSALAAGNYLSLCCCFMTDE